MSEILIITGGEVDITSSLGYISKKKYEKIIAVDGGIEAVKKMNLPADILIGDFDTADPLIVKEYEKRGSQVIRLNPIKDDTDTEAAFKYAKELGAKKVDIFGACGSRFDHMYANLFLLKRAQKYGMEANIITKMSRISLISKSKTVYKKDLYGKYISFIQFDGSAKGVTIKDFVYEIENFDFDTDKTFRLGVSNELEKEKGSIYIENGCMLMIESKDDRL